jgi:tetratricopeptide (TPR) repeat protein
MRRYSNAPPRRRDWSTFDAPAGSRFQSDLQSAVVLHQRGLLVEAESAYRNLLARRPDAFQVKHLLGLVKHQQGSHGEALDLISAALTTNPDNASSLSNHGAVLNALKRFDDALASFDKAVRLAPDFAMAWYNRGLALQGLARHEEAVSSHDKATTLRPIYAEAWNSRGVSLAAMNKLDLALGSFARAATEDPGYAEAFVNQGTVLSELERFDEALTNFDRAVTLNANQAATWRSRGIVLSRLSRFAEALASYDRALALDSDNAETFYNRGNALKELDRLDDALVAYAQALELKPDHARVYNNRGMVLQELNYLETALESFEAAIAVDPASAEAHCNRANVLRDLNRAHDALASYEKAIALRPDDAEMLHCYATQLLELGRVDDANVAAERAIELSPRNPKFYRALGNTVRFTEKNRHIKVMEDLHQSPTLLSDDDKIELNFALGRAYEDLAQYDKALGQYLIGNGLKRSQITYNEQETLCAMNRNRSVFTSEAFRLRNCGGNPSNIPIFIVGMPRSGSTLVEQVLASHPEVFGAGELKSFSNTVELVQTQVASGLIASTDQEFRLLAELYLSDISQLAPRGMRIADKLLGNFIFVGLIHMILPNAAIVHTVRDPIDTCVSCFSTLFAEKQNHTYDLTELGRYYRHYQVLMAHWHRVLPTGRILDVRYEDLVVQPEVQIARMLEYCRLEWDPRCLEFYKTERSVRTASLAQVRRPLYTSSIGRWRSCRSLLDPLFKELGLVDVQPV